MNTNYGRIVNGRLEYAPSSLVTPSGVTVNPTAATYRKAGWLRVEPVPPPPEGYTNAISGYTWGDETITPIVKNIPIETPPRTFSKLKLVTALTERNLWQAVKDWLDETGYGDFFIAAQNIREDHPAFKLALAAARTRFSLPESEIAAILSSSVTDDTP